MEKITELRVGDYLEWPEFNTWDKYKNIVDSIVGVIVVGGVDYDSWEKYIIKLKTDCRLVVHEVRSKLYLGFIHYDYHRFCAGRKLTYDQVMSLKKADWDSAPEGAEFYADGSFYMCRFIDAYYWGDKGWCIDVGQRKQNLMAFDDYEEKPGKSTKLDGDCNIDDGDFAKYKVVGKAAPEFNEELKSQRAIELAELLGYKYDEKGWYKEVKEYVGKV